MHNKIAGLVALALVLVCCGLPLLITVGVLGSLAAWLTSGPGVAIVVAGIVIIGIAIFVRYARPKNSGLDDADDNSARSCDRRK